MKDLKSIDEVVQFFEEVKGKPNGKFLLAQIYGMAKDQEEESKKRREIIDLLNLSQGYYAVDVVIINDIAIVEVEKNRKGKKETYFYSVVNGKRTHEVTDNFDFALIIALSIKYGVSSYAPQAIYQILQMDKYAEKHKPKTFVQKCISGEATVEEIDDYIDQWHNGNHSEPLHEFLGMTEEEYNAWVADHKKIYEIIVSAIKKNKQD